MLDRIRNAAERFNWLKKPLTLLRSKNQRDPHSEKIETFETDPEKKFIREQMIARFDDEQMDIPLSKDEGQFSIDTFYEMQVKLEEAKANPDDQITVFISPDDEEYQTLISHGVTFEEIKKQESFQSKTFGSRIYLQ